VSIDRKQLIANYRADHPAEAAGNPDRTVEALALSLGDASTEALVEELYQRGYAVTLGIRWLHHAG
jgi:hypothetical protein